MKAHSNYTTTLATVTWLRHGAALSLALAALILGLILLWRTNGPLTLPISASDSFTRPTSGPIASCRACRDEWVAARAAPAALVDPTNGASQQLRGVSAQRPVSHANSSIDDCRVCRDEWIAAQSPSMPTGGVAFDQPEELFRTSGPR